MKITSVLSFCFVFLASVLSLTKAAHADNDNGIYIVYMGAAASSKGLLRNDQAKLLNTLLRRNKNAVVHTYKQGFSGFAARLTPDEAHSIAQTPGVVSVFPDSRVQLHTTRSWDFLLYQTAVKIDSGTASQSVSQESDTIIGILDTGIWPESESFIDKDMGPIPSRWKGTCMEGPDFKSTNCNKKLIGARYYKDDDDAKVRYLSARDILGHGTHVASTAGGTPVNNASFYGLASGTAKGGAPGARIAMYRVCSMFGCRSSAILAAFDDAIADGVDVLSLSLGSPASFMPELPNDPIAIGAFHAVEKGITVVCSAGNDGPSLGTVVNAAPWILTVAASTIDRDFEADVVLGGKKVIKGEGINFANINTTPNYPLIYAESAKKSDANEADARNCNPESMEQEQIKGGIVLCASDDNNYSALEKKETVKSLGGIGLVLINDQTRKVANNYGSFPMTVISSVDAAQIISYVNSTKNPTATILPTKDIKNYKPAPSIAYFSSRGPSSLAKSILKPDISAPGVNILAAWIANDTSEVPAGKKPALFNVISGTSMACPHVSGIAASIKSQNPEWSPSAVKSAIMTTAIQINNMKLPITSDSDSTATPYDFGAGEVSPSAPLQPGLLYEMTSVDYLNFLCYLGYNISTIKIISRTVPSSFSCPQDSSADHISNINYPSIAIQKLGGQDSKKVNRTVTNVAGDGDAVYTATVDAPAELHVQVNPEKLKFSKNGEKLTYEVLFSPTKSSLDKDVFGSITWSNGKYNVRIPFAVGS